MKRRGFIKVLVAACSAPLLQLFRKVAPAAAVEPCVDEGWGAYREHADSPAGPWERIETDSRGFGIGPTKRYHRNVITDPEFISFGPSIDTSPRDPGGQDCMQEVFERETFVGDFPVRRVEFQGLSARFEGVKSWSR